ncbi:MAG: 4-hydroxy-tetrahydrodipicolinate reductase [Clostridia bacterium]|nr:4-hydroxy-tetrahydrodipicolinate reductase [Clostridia bacterium]
MTGILLSGAFGKMGKAICSKVDETDDFQIIAGIDIVEKENVVFPVYKSFDLVPDSVINRIDVIIDFSNPSVFSSLLDFMVKNRKPAVIATTGLSDEQIVKMKSAAYEVPVFFSANMSLGVNLICELAKKAAKALGDDFDIEILEMHHNQKIDAPSGTALMIADSISNEFDEKPDYVYDRASKRVKRSKSEIGIQSVRAGNIVGEHQVIFAGTDEVITLSHSARSKTLFASGALSAAKMIIKKENGLYSMKELIDG